MKPKVNLHLSVQSQLMCLCSVDWEPKTVPSVWLLDPPIAVEQGHVLPNKILMVSWWSCLQAASVKLCVASQPSLMVLACKVVLLKVVNFFLCFVHQTREKFCIVTSVVSTSKTQAFASMQADVVDDAIERIQNHPMKYCSLAGHVSSYTNCVVCVKWVSLIETWTNK